MQEFDWKNKRGERIQAFDWECPSPKAVIALVHGYAEHFGRYSHVCEYYQEKGINVVGVDLVGHGKSEGQRGHIDDFNELLDITMQLLDEVASKYPNLPVILYGHSLGGSIVHNTYLKRKPTIAGLISTGAWVQLAFQPSAFMMTLGKMMNKIAPKFSQNSELDVSHLATNQAVGEAYANDPLVHKKISARMGMQNLAAGDYLHQYAGTVQVPHLLQHGKDDPITSQPASEAFANRLKGDITYQSYEGLRHEIHNELNFTKILDNQYDWMVEKGIV